MSTVRNTYREEGSGTRVLTDASLGFGRVPGFIQRRIGGRLLDRADAEDFSYVLQHGFRTIAGSSARG